MEVSFAKIKQADTCRGYNLAIGVLDRLGNADPFFSVKAWRLWRLVHLLRRRRLS
jgi:hypothetical protein